MSSQSEELQKQKAEKEGDQKIIEKNLVYFIYPTVVALGK